jgi:hypothetical protein
MATTLTGDDFQRPAHEITYDAILALYQQHAPIDAITVADHLTKQGDLRRAGGAPYLHSLISEIPSAANAAYYAELVRERAALRRVAAAGVRVQQMAEQSTGGDAEQIVTAAVDEITHVAQRYTDYTLERPSSWAPVDIANLDIEATIEPTLLARDDGVCMLYPASVHSIVGEPGSAKSWLALWAARQQLLAEQPVVMVDFEDRPGRVVRRLLDLGVPRDLINGLFRYIRPDQALTPAQTPGLARACDGAALAIIDGVTEAMTLHGLSLQDNEDIAKYLMLLPRRIADLGPAVAQVDHVVKDPDARGRYALGGGHKLAGIDGAQYKMNVTERFGRGKRGHAQILIDKDRHGGIEQHSVGISMADFVMDSTPFPERPDEPGPLRIYLNAPDASVIGPAGEFRPTLLMSRISDYLVAVDGPSQTAIENYLGGNRDNVRKAIRALVNEGYVRIERHGQATRHYLISPFDDTQETLP